MVAYSATLASIFSIESSPMVNEVTGVFAGSRPEQPPQRAVDVFADQVVNAMSSPQRAAGGKPTQHVQSIWVVQAERAGS